MPTIDSFLLRASLLLSASVTALACGSTDDATSAGDLAPIEDGTAPDGAAAPDGEAAPDAAAQDAGADASKEAGTPKIMSPIARNFADPVVLHAGGAYHLYATNGRGKNVPHVTSTDLSSWSLGAENDAMPKLPSWAAPEGIVWAPGVLQVSAARFVLFFSTKRAGSGPVGEKGQMCIGRAVATSPAGPFVDTHAAPLYCESSRWSIDPSPFADADGSLHLVWRQDADDPARTTAMNTVYVRKLASDGASFAADSTATELLRRTNGSWEDPILENPAMVVANGKRYLFYSANLWQSASYAVGYAVCASAAGPCTKKSMTAPWLSSQPSIGMTGPGGEEVIRTMGGAVDVTPQGDLLMTMHGWLGPSIEAAGAGKPGIRAPWLARLSVSGSAPVITAWP